MKGLSAKTSLRRPTDRPRFCAYRGCTHYLRGARTYCCVGCRVDHWDYKRLRGRVCTCQRINRRLGHVPTVSDAAAFHAAACPRAARRRGRRRARGKRARAAAR